MSGQESESTSAYSGSTYLGSISRTKWVHWQPMANWNCYNETSDEWWTPAAGGNYSRILTEINITYGWGSYPGIRRLRRWNHGGQLVTDFNTSISGSASLSYINSMSYGVWGQKTMANPIGGFTTIWRWATFQYQRNPGIYVPFYVHVYTDSPYPATYIHSQHLPDANPLSYTFTPSMGGPNTFLGSLYITTSTFPNP